MSPKKEPEQFILDREDKLRIELQGKINTLDQKIDQKVSNHVLYSIIPISLILLVGVFGYAFTQINKFNDKTDQINDRLIRLETKMESVKPPK